MGAVENSKGDATDRLGASQLEVTGLEVPQLGNAKQRLRKPKNLPRTELPLFTNKPYEMMATGAPVISATQAYLKSPDWNEYGHGRLYFQKPFGKGRSIEFYILNKQEHQPDSISNQAEQKILDQYGVMAARLHAVFATYAARQAEPWKEPFVLRGSDLIKTLQIYKTKKLTKSQKLKAIADLALVVGTLGAVIHWYEGELDLCVKERTLLWIVSVQEYSQPCLLEEADRLYEVIIRVQPGLWTYSFLNAQGERQRKALYQYGLIPKQLFDVDPYRQKLATSLALYLIQNSRAHKSGAYTIETLLSNVLPRQEISQTLQNYVYAWRLKEKLDEALLVLRDAVGLEIEFDDETYPIWLRPSWGLPDNLHHLPTKVRNQQLLGMKKMPDNYIQNHWLPATLTLTMPPGIQERLDAFINRKASDTNRIVKRKSIKPSMTHATLEGQSDRQPTQTPPQLPTSTPPACLTGDTVKQMRETKGWTQAYLASLVGKSVSWVKLIESGRRRIQDADRLTLRQVLGLTS